MEFLSDEWFSKVNELRAAAGDLDVPDALKGAVVNINVTNGDMNHAVHLKEGNIEDGHDAGATATLSLSADLAKKIFIDNDQAAGMQAFMAGEIKIEGDMNAVMQLQMVQPSDAQKALLEQIRAITD